MKNLTAREILQNQEMSITCSRIDILEVILSFSCPFSAKDLHKILDDHSIDLSTIYRNLSLFEKRGLVRFVTRINRERYYSNNCVHNPLHPHFHCKECGKLFCLSPFTFDDTKHLLQLVKGNYHIDDVRVTFVGSCPDCIRGKEGNLNRAKAQRKERGK